MMIYKKAHAHKAHLSSMHSMVTERQHTSAHNHQPRRDPQTGRWVTLSTEDIQAQKQSGRNPFYTYRDPNTGQWYVVQPDGKDMEQGIGQ